MFQFEMEPNGYRFRLNNPQSVRNYLGRLGYKLWFCRGIYELTKLKIWVIRSKYSDKLIGQMTIDK